MDKFECGDLRVRDDNGLIIYDGPRFLRCQQVECAGLVTHGMIQQHGGCECGGVRIKPAVLVKPEEQAKLLDGDYPMLKWEKEALNEFV